MLKRLQNKFNIKWLRVSILYHKFPNVRELFQGNLITKLNKHIELVDFMDLSCNCSALASRREMCIKQTIQTFSCGLQGYMLFDGKFYIGNTHQMLKKKFDGHLGEFCDLVNKAKSSDSFAKHFTSLFKGESKIARHDIR